MFEGGSTEAPPHRVSPACNIHSTGSVIFAQREKGSEKPSRSREICSPKVPFVVQLHSFRIYHESIPFPGPPDATLSSTTARRYAVAYIHVLTSLIRG